MYLLPMEQKLGCGTNSPSSPIVANLFMENYEGVAINSFHFKPIHVRIGR